MERGAAIAPDRAREGRRGWSHPRIPRVDRRLVLDAALAVGLAIVAVVEAWPAPLPPPELWSRVDWLRYLTPLGLALASTLPLLARRRFPVAVMVVLGLAMVGWESRAGGSSVAFLALFVAVFSAGAYATDRRRSLAGFGTLVAALLALWALGTPRREVDPWLLFTLAFFSGVWLAGDALRSRTAHARELEDRAEELEGQRRAALERAAAEERARIARELHDVIAHSLSVVVIQAGAARRVLDEQPEAAREALRHVETTGRVAMTEMRRLLGVLRHGGEPLTVPQPGIAGLAGLVDDVRGAGLNVTLETAGDPRSLPPGAEVSVYRIVQEALTNTLRHAAASEARVAIRYLPEAVEIVVTDDGRGVGEPAPSAVGHGLSGMRERAALFGGTFHAGPRREGGFEVRVSLPVEPAGMS